MCGASPTRYGSSATPLPRKASGEGRQQLLNESVRLFRDVGDQHTILWATRTLAWTYEELGDREHARELHQENLGRARALGNEQLEATLLGALSMIAVDEGQVEDALSMLKEALRMFRDLGDPMRTAVNLCRSAHALAVAERAGAAAQLLSCSETLLEELGANVPWVARMNDETLTTIRTQLDDAALADAWEQGRALTVDEAVALTLDS